MPINKVEDTNLIKIKDMKLNDLFIGVKVLWSNVEAAIEGGTSIFEDIKTKTAGITDPAEFVQIVATEMVANESKLPAHWRGTNLEKAIIKFCVKLENGTTDAEVEAVVKGILASKTATTTTV